MEISSIQNYYRMQAVTNPVNAKKTVEANDTQTADTRGTDTIDISSEASFKSGLSKAAKTYTAKSSEKISAERIAELKEQYEGDACPVSGSEIAAKIIAGILGPGTKD